MVTHKKILIAAALTAVLSAEVLAAEVASVNGRSITVQDVEEPLERLHLNYVDATGKVEYLLNQLITNELLFQEGLRRKLEEQPEVRAKLQTAKRDILIDAMQKKIENEKQGDEQLKQFYEDHLDAFRPVMISQIMVGDEEKAKAIHKQLKEGAEFSELGNEHSQPVPGNPGYLTRGSMAKPLDEAVFSLDVNEISEPVQTGFGYHIIKVMDSKEPKEFDKLTSREINSVEYVIYNDAIAQLKRDAEVNIYKDRLGAHSALKGANLSAEQALPSSVVLASVNGQDITAEEFASSLKAADPKVWSYYGSPLGKPEFLNLLIEKELLYQQALRLKLDQDEHVLARFEDDRHAILAVAMREELKDETSGDEQAKQFYTDHPEKFQSLKLSHIQLGPDEEKKARELYEMLKDGADFAELAEKYSQDGTTKFKGGELGYISIWHDIDKPLRDEAWSLEVNAPSEPIETKYGYHIIKVLDVKDPQKFDELIPVQVEPVKDIMFRHKIDQLAEAAKIVVDGRQFAKIVAQKEER